MLMPQSPCAVPCTYSPTAVNSASKKRQRGAIGCAPAKKRRVQARQSLAAPVQLSKLLKTNSASVLELVVPDSDRDYMYSKSSKKHTVWLPLWVELGGVRYYQLAEFPGLLSGERYSAGAQGCVAAYACLDKSLGLDPIALKAVPMFSSKRKNRTSYSNRRSTWSCEWKLHEYLQKQGFVGTNPTVEMYGGVAASVHGVHQVYFAMELMDKDMFTVLEENHQDGKWLIKVLLNTAKSLRALHNAGIIYCDLKPENILVRQDGTAKFGDFDRSCIPELNLGIIGGTKGYESPERMEDSMKRSVEDDVWAFGVTILISATMASSPYSDLSREDLDKFEPSNFLETQCRQDWTVRQMKHLGALCDRILRIEPSERASLDYIIAELTRILTLNEYPAESPMLVRAVSSDSMIGLGLPLTDLTRESPLSNSTINCSASTTSSHAYTGVYIPEVERIDEYGRTV